MPRGFKNAITYHLGSVALGSFIIAVIQLVKYYLLSAALFAKLGWSAEAVQMLTFKKYCPVYVHLSVN